MFLASYIWSRAKSKGSQQRLTNISFYNPSTGVCGDKNGVRNTMVIADIDALAVRQCAAIRSSNPNEAFNFLSDGSATAW